MYFKTLLSIFTEVKFSSWMLDTKQIKLVTYVKKKAKSFNTFY